MGRLLEEVIHVTGRLVAATPVHSGGLADGAFSDLPLAADGAGRIYFPGTGLAGPLRAWWRSAASSRELDEIWGRVEGDPGEDVNRGWASAMFIEDAPLVEHRTELRQHVGIDEHTGTAQGMVKFDRQLAPRASGFEFSLELQRPVVRQSGQLGDAHWNDTLALLRGMLEDLQAGAIRFGADKSRGLGVLVLEDVSIRSQDLGAAILDGLTDPDGGESLDIDTYFGGDAPVEARRPADSCIDLAVTCHSVAPVMQKHEAEGSVSDIMPAVTGDANRKLRPFVSGPGIKGVFRAQSLRIMRTLLPRGKGASLAGELVAALYGAAATHTGRARRADPKSSRYRRQGRGAVNFDDTFVAAGGLSEQQFLRLLTLTSPGNDDARLSALKDALGRTEWSAFSPTILVAIDRWLSTAADGFLFSRLEPALGTFPIQCQITPERIAPPDAFWKRLDMTDEHGATEAVAESALAQFQKAAMALFLLTLRDFARGCMPIGFGGNRGLGDIRFDEVRFAPGTTFHGLPLGEALSAADFEDPEKMSRFQPLQEGWTGHITQLRELSEGLQ